jgi:hypothetical protein
LITLAVSSLESEPAINVPASSNSAKPSSRHIKLIAIIAVAAILVVVGGLLVSSMLVSPQNEENQWLFKGAYANYDGRYDGEIMNISISVDFSVQEEIVDFNSTHALVSTSFKITPSIGEAQEESNTTWVPLSQMGFMNAFDEGNITKTYETTVNIPNCGTRTCTVYEYTVADDVGLTMTVYVDKAIGWPVKMSASMPIEGSTGLQLDINLTETNIPGLS